MSRTARRLRLAAACLLMLPLLAACRGAPVPMQPAPYAHDPACAEVSVRLPEQLDGRPLRHTNAQATGAWGDPAVVLLRCGVEPPGPTGERCVSLNGIDWVQDSAAAPDFRFVSYGRTPAVEVVVAGSDPTVSGTNVLVDLQDAVGRLPVTGGCVGAEDLLGERDGTALPSP